MKMVPTSHGIDTPVSNEEILVIEKIGEQVVNETDLKPREVLLAERLARRGVVDCTYSNNKKYFSVVKRSTQ